MKQIVRKVADDEAMIYEYMQGDLWDEDEFQKEDNGFKCTLG